MFEVFKIIGTVAMNNKDALNSLDETVSAGKNASGKLGTIIAGAGKALTAVAATAATAVGTMATGIATITKSAIDNYGEYEQLVGGSKLMFGDAYDYIAEQAQNAFSTVQMSQNDYLRQVNGFATGLKTALDGDEMAAAELSHKIIKAEADVVAATGNSQEAVQNAFNGIMKSNYTMLDNLQLGIKPTKEGMQEVIDQVNAWNEANGNATHYMIDNLADTQAALVDYIAMQGLAGYAGEEAGSTIQGSMASVKAAWDNLITGMADPEQDFGTLMENFIGSATAFLEQNLFPRIQQAIPRVISGLSTLIQKVADYVPTFLQEMLPPLLEGAVLLLNELATNLPSLIKSLLPQIISAISGLITSIVSEMPKIIEELFEGINSDIGSKISGLFSEMMNLGQELYPQIQELFATLISVAPQLLDIVFQVIDVIKPVFSLLSPILSLVTSMISPLITIVSGLLTPLVDILGKVIAMLVPIISKVIEQLAIIFPQIQQIFEFLTPALNLWFEALGVVLEGVISMVQGVLDIVMGIVTFWLNVFTGNFQGAWDSFIQMLKGFWELLKGFLETIFVVLVTLIKTGILDKIIDITEKIRDAFIDKFNEAMDKVKAAIETIKGFLNFKWKLPDLKMPHFKVDGEFSLNPLSVPTFKIDWYAKAMNNPMLLTQPTAFGINAAGQLMAGGEAGSEVVSGTDTLMNMIASAVSAQNQGLILVLEAILDVLSNMDDNMPEKVREAISGTSLTVSNREFARLVKAVN